MNKPLINILTRTSNRPNGFEINRNSILSQSYDQIRQIVSVDDDVTENYVKNHDVDYIKVNREDIIKNDTSLNPNTGAYSPHNLYFNELLKEIKDGWVMILDDDDRLSSKDSIEKIVNQIKDEDTVIIWQMRFPNNIAIPPTELINHPPTIGRIGSPCMLFHSKYLGNTTWDGWKCGDFRFIDAIYKKIPNKVGIAEMLVTIGQIGDGKRGDL